MYRTFVAYPFIMERTLSLLDEVSSASSAATEGAPGVGGASKSGSCTVSVVVLLALALE